MDTSLFYHGLVPTNVYSVIERADADYDGLVSAHCVILLPCGCPKSCSFVDYECLICSS